MLDGTADLLIRFSAGYLPNGNDASKAGMHTFVAGVRLQGRLTPAACMLFLALGNDAGRREFEQISETLFFKGAVGIGDVSQP